jgi:hypothetical protein
MVDYKKLNQSVAENYVFETDTKAYTSDFVKISFSEVRIELLFEGKIGYKKK